ncbi:MAG TPA: M14 family metallopeptidase, partial [Phycisphaerae bacterium]|nr:M14 family metallopeptidase [Phycisphaerae bacterium]
PQEGEFEGEPAEPVPPQGLPRNRHYIRNAECLTCTETLQVVYIDPNSLPDHWRTKAERTNYEETARYDEATDFCRRLADASPYAHYTSFGRSGEGRELPLLILSQERAFTPAAARRSGKLVVLVQNCIHPGECAGKDASLELARDILITGTCKDLLNEVVLLIMPIFNVDGHERFSPHSRINQNGPKEMGWRVTATNLNLNRDYTKADAVEMQAWLRTWVAWQPDLFFDNHTTNGSDHQYVLLYAATNQHLVAPPIATWMDETLLSSVLPALAADGHLVFPYSGPRDRKDLSKGVGGPGAFMPRFSTGYSAICNRPSILLEAHAHKTYKQRVRATYEFVRHVVEELNRGPEALRDAIRAADELALQTRGGDGPDGNVVLREQRTEQSGPIVYKAVEFTVRKSDITGGEVLEYSDRPIDVETAFYSGTRIAETVTPPAAYLVPPQWTDVIHRLELHGVEFFRLRRAERLEVESYRFDDVSFAPRPYESRQMPRYKTVRTNETRDFVVGTVVVPLDQVRAKLAVHLLEPEAPDALIAWGFFNAIFEQKEYFESYAMEPIARQMLVADPELKREFEEKLRTDEKFAKSPGARLHFFYRHSPYWDESYNLYPVARLPDATTLRRLKADALR